MNVLRQVQLVPNVKVYKANTKEWFSASSFKTFAHLVEQAEFDFVVDVHHPRLYYMGRGDAPDQHRTFRNEEEWRPFVDEWNSPASIPVRFMYQELSPVPSPTQPASVSAFDLGDDEHTQNFLQTQSWWTGTDPAVVCAPPYVSTPLILLTNGKRAT
jgi:hypothetical protein